LLNPKSKNPNKGNKVIALTLGDPRGIGPEVIAKSLAAYSPSCSLAIVGCRRFFPDLDIRVIDHIAEIKAGEAAFLETGDGPAGTDLSYFWVKTAVELALRGEVQALVTAPVSKNKWLESGLPYRGHTDFLATVARDGAPAMFFWSPGLKVALFTHHIALREVFARLTREAIQAFTGLVAAELRRLFCREFTFLFSGLNPHAGEEGHLGHEEIDTIIPAIDALRAQIPVAGLYPPDVVFAKARAMKNAVVIAWTHDQGLIPFKLLQAVDGVQLTLGLPFIRTSPVHGTAYDIAGRGIADPASMLAAIRLAESLLR
jgi:4-hydroxythreonine-4-phosphate dehydrogenase